MKKFFCLITVCFWAALASCASKRLFIKEIQPCPTSSWKVSVYRGSKIAFEGLLSLEKREINRIMCLLDPSGVLLACALGEGNNLRLIESRTGFLKPETAKRLLESLDEMLQVACNLQEGEGELQVKLGPFILKQMRWHLGAEESFPVVQMRYPFKKITINLKPLK